MTLYPIDVMSREVIVSCDDVTVAHYCICIHKRINVKHAWYDVVSIFLWPLFH